MDIELEAIPPWVKNWKAPGAWVRTEEDKALCFIQAIAALKHYDKGKSKGAMPSPLKLMEMAATHIKPTRAKSGAQQLMRQIRQIDKIPVPAVFIYRQEQKKSHEVFAKARTQRLNTEKVEVLDPDAIQVWIDKHEHVDHKYTPELQPLLDKWRAQHWFGRGTLGTARELRKKMYAIEEFLLDEPPAKQEEPEPEEDDDDR